MCHGANLAFQELSQLGSCTSGSVMVPCPWFPEAAEMAVRNPGLDLGVHLTLTSEKPYYRWRPLTAPPPAAGLTDAQGYMWPDVPSLRRHANVEAVEAEMRAQIEAAVQAGIDITHLDAHMGAAMAPEFSSVYLALGKEFALPVLLAEQLADYGPRGNLGVSAERGYDNLVARARAQGNPIFKAVIETPWDQPTPVDQVYKRLFDDLPAGPIFFSLHFNAPGEVEVIEPQSAFTRIAEYELFRSADFRDWLTQRGFHLIGFRALREAYRDANLAKENHA